MRQIRNFLFFTILISAISSCIEPYSPNLGGGSTAKYVVNGQITDQEGYQTVSISMSSTIGEPQYNPLTGCEVKIIDNNSNVYQLDEFEKGNYRVWMAKESLNPGNSYQVNILTSLGVEIVSDFDKMSDCPEIDSVYFIREDIPTTNPDKPLQGIQFYIDLNGENTNSHYFRWEVIETWEHHAAYPKIWFWDKRNIIRFTPPDYSMFLCWSTQKVANIYTLSTEKLLQNRYSMFKLHFVDNLTQRLTFCYSIVVNQFSISDSAYMYWDKLRINSSEQGGLYGAQPLRFKGNLRCITNPALEVLGYFSASSVKTKRLYIQDVENLDKFYLQCKPRTRLGSDLNKEETQYLTESGQIIEDACIECNTFGGSFVKPDNWPYNFSPYY